jgi:hypothetical protein
MKKHERNEHTQRLLRPALATLTVGALAFAATALPTQESAQDGAAQVDETRAVLDKWVETRRLIREEERTWALGREMVQERIGIVTRELESVRENITAAEASIAEADKQRLALVEENDTLAAASTELTRIVGELETRMKALMVRLPEPLLERMRARSQMLPDDAATTKLSLSERFGTIVVLLNEVDKFNREVTLTSELRTLADGTNAEVTALYLGLGQAYYATTAGTQAGVGLPGAEGWKWVPNDAIATAVALAIAIQKGEEVASFVRLPVRVE